jgi:hypothetical protein
MRGVKIALVAGLTLLAVTIGLTLLRSPTIVAATNKPHDSQEVQIASTRRSTNYCQSGETLPQGTTAIRLSLSASIGPRVRVTASIRGDPIASGAEDSGWTGSIVAVSVKPLRHTVSGVRICASFALANETLVLLGEHTHAAVAAREAGRPLQGRMWVEYLRPGPRSWASLGSSVIRNMGYGRAWGGSGIALLVLALLAIIALLASRVALTEMR